MRDNVHLIFHCHSWSAVFLLGKADSKNDSVISRPARTATSSAEPRSNAVRHAILHIPQSACIIIRNNTTPVIALWNIKCSELCSNTGLA
jgi:hypothetical protein